MKKIILIMCIMVMASGCAITQPHQSQSSGTSSSTVTKPSQIVEAGEHYQVEKVNASDVTSNPDGQFGNAFSAINFQLGMDVLKSMLSESPDDNHMFSPLSLSFALAMLQNGAEGDTKDQINALLGDVDVNEAYKNIMMYLTQNNDEDQKLLLANSFWLRNEMTPEQSFIDQLQASYDADVFISDFNNTATVDDMNQWVEDQTNNLLKDTIDQLDPDTLAILMNTVYFKAAWAEQFDEDATLEEEFFINNEESTSVDMMHQSAYFRYYEDESCQSIILPYMNGTEMVIILPNDNINDYVMNLDHEILSDLVTGQGFESNQVELALPKFNFDSKIELNDVLMSLGMTDAFSEDLATFPNIVQEDVQVWVSRIFQNTTIDLNEQGTEAAAVTVVEMKFTSAMPDSNPIRMTCDRPFMFIIKDTTTDMPLFMGTYTGK